MSTSISNDSPQAIAADIASIARISAVPRLLKVICGFTGMGFAAVARVTDGTWTACAVQDDIGFGLLPGGQLDVNTTLCVEARALNSPIAFDHASQDPVYRDHHTPRIYGLESYISVPILRRDGSYFGNLCAIDPRPASVANERTLGMFALFSELIASQLESEDRQIEMERQLVDEQAMAQLREQFIAVLGHDLRNPLSAVAATAEMLVRREDEPEGRKAGLRLRVIAERMNGLVGDVMDMARGHLGSGVNVELVPTDQLGSRLLDVVLELRMAHPARRIEARIAIDRPVRCDTVRLQQLVSNLLGNALTYGSPDQPIVVEAGTADDRLVISVQNAGPPIELDDLQKVFEPYWRSPTSKPGGGLGLGLYICGQIARAHGGGIEVASTAGAGTCFTANLPVDPG